MLQRTTVRLFILLFWIVLWSNAPVLAQGASQQQAAPQRVPVTIALADELPDATSPSVILRRPGATPHDVILLRSSTASGKHLSDAIVHLLMVRVLSGDTALKATTMRVVPREGPQGQIRREYPWVQRVYNDLRKAEAKPLSGVGTVPMVQIWLPPQRGRRR